MLLRQSVTEMPTARTLKALTFVLVTWDSLEMGRRAKVKKAVLDKGDVLVVVVVVVYVYVVVLSLFSIHELSQKCYCVLTFVKGEGVIAC